MCGDGVDGSDRPCKQSYAVDIHALFNYNLHAVGVDVLIWFNLYAIFFNLMSFHYIHKKTF